MVTSVIILAAALTTPETSTLFEKRVEPVNGMVGYVLKERLDFNQQTFYFTQKSMTDDGRFLLFETAPANRRFAKQLAMVDFAADKLVKIEGVVRRKDNEMGYLDVEKDEYWYLDDKAFYKRELLKSPQKPIFICKVPTNITARGNIDRLFTHLTLNRTRDQAYFDVRYSSGLMVQGLMNFTTGIFTEWSENQDGRIINHGEINPVRDDLALCAQEVGGNMQNIDGLFPRIQLNVPGRCSVVEAVMCNNGATHQTWAPDGNGYIYCGNGCTYHELATRQETAMISPLYADHANLSYDNRYLIFDRHTHENNWYRGCQWNVIFFNRETGKHVFVYYNSAALNEKGVSHPLHPDPHPNFACHDRYVVCSFNDDKKRLNVMVVPVAQLIKVTEGPKIDTSTLKTGVSREVRVY